MTMMTRRGTLPVIHDACSTKLLLVTTAQLLSRANCKYEKLETQLVLFKAILYRCRRRMRRWCG